MKSLIAAPLILFAVSAMAQTPPACGDKKTTDTVVRVLRDSIVPLQEFKAVPLDIYMKRVSLEATVPTEYQKDIKRFRCSATVIVDASKGPDPVGRAILNDPQKMYENGLDVMQMERIYASDIDVKTKRFSFAITYTSQVDESRHYVQVSGITKGRAMFLGTYVAAHAQ